MNNTAFDWVEARANCTIESVFKQLSEDVQGDLKRFINLRPGLAESREFGECDKDRFYVRHKQRHTVVFEISDSKIHIGRWAFMGEHTPLMVLRVGLGDDGKCRLIDEDQNEWKPWQVRRKALEETLFGAS